jgi:hypothetical protein
MPWQPPQGGIMSLLPQQPPSFQLNGGPGAAMPQGTMPPWMMQQMLNHYAYQPTQANQGMPMGQQQRPQGPYQYQPPTLQNPFQPRPPNMGPPTAVAPSPTGINGVTNPAQASQSGLPGGFASVDDWMTAMQSNSGGGGGGG